VHQKAVEILQADGVEPSDVVAVGITNQRETTVVWDAITGEPLHNAIGNKIFYCLKYRIFKITFSLSSVTCNSLLCRMCVLKQNPLIESIDLLIESALITCLIYYNLLYVKVGVGNDLLLLSGMLGTW